MYGVLVTVSWVGEADEASIGWLMVWWSCGGGKLKGVAKRRCATVAGSVECKVREAVSLRISFRPNRQGEPKRPGDFAIDNVSVRRGKCRDEVGRDMA